jgi:hypothetical protein
VPDSRLGALTLAIALSGVFAGADAAAGQRPNFVGFRGDMGIEVPHGDPGEVFLGNVRGEFSILVTPRWLHPVYVGVGQGWVAFPVHPDYGVARWPATAPDTDTGEWWNLVGAYLLAGITLDSLIHFPLYAEGRYVFNRLRQLSSDEWEGRPEVGRLKYTNYKGCGLSGVIGIELPLAQRTWVDSSLRLSQFSPRVDLSDPEDFGLIDIRDGWMLGIQLGLVWFP